MSPLQLKLNRLFVLIITLTFSLGYLVAENCDLKVNGSVVDPFAKISVPGALIKILDTDIFVYTDSTGYFSFDSICPGEYHIWIVREGWETEKFFAVISSDTSFTILLDGHNHLVDEIAVFGERHRHSTGYNATLGYAALAHRPDLGLATALEKLPGVNIIKNGNNIAKPVIHGMFGTRITLLNNGVSHSSQQWGLDHAPEIDPLGADEITIIKGVPVVEYQGSQIGGLILSEAPGPPKDPHLHGGIRSYLVSNGRGAGTSLRLGSGGNEFGWNGNLTIRKSGDLHSPDYFLNNTGSEEISAAINSEYNISDLISSELYLSTYNSNIGVLRGSHIGNLTDLEKAMSNRTPFFTEDYHSYEIEAPYQSVSHNYAKLGLKYSDPDVTFWETNVAFQHNMREEFDVRRGGRSERPALSLDKMTGFAEFKYGMNLSDNTELKTGGQWTGIRNTNDPGTGILPLIPDYTENKTGIFALFSNTTGELLLECGARYDYVVQDVATISRTIPREIIRYDNNYNNFSAGIGIAYPIFEGSILGYNIHYADRNPDISELYSQGLHQGTSGIEIGKPELNKESALINTLTIEGKIGETVSFDTQLYHHIFDGYIYLMPTGRSRLTIRGAFPVFEYSQTDAHIYGLDATIRWDVTETIHPHLGFSYIRGDENTTGNPLVFMPSNRGRLGFDYHSLSLSWIEELEIKVLYEIVFEQTNLEKWQDFMDPPPTYSLLGIMLTSKKVVGEDVFIFSLGLDNVLNTRYRDYLDRQRYFADAVGFSATLGIGWEF